MRLLTRKEVRCTVCNLGFGGLFASISSHQIKDAIWEVDTSKISVQKRGIAYTLIEPQPIDSWIACKLVKAFPKEHTSLDEQFRRLVKLPIIEAAFVWVLVNGDLAVALIEEKPGYQLGLQAVMGVVSNLLGEAFAKKGLYPAIEILPILSEKSFTEAIRRIVKMETLKIELLRPNPKYRAIWGPVKEELDRLQADKVASKYTSRDGLRTEQSEFVKGALSMVEDGYGRALAVGKGERNITIKVDSLKVKSLEIVLPGGPDRWAQELKTLTETIRRRFKSDK